MDRIGTILTFVLGLLLTVALAPGTARASTVADEPSYDKTCPLWPPTEYQCTILSAKDAMAKFSTMYRGGVHTIYCSQTLGHCPLVPERAVLMKRFDQGIQVHFATGAEPDHRDAPRPDITQELYGNYLPIVVTRWLGRDDGLKYEETSFGRLIGDRLTIKRGDENGAAMVRLKIENTTDKDVMAPVRLVVNGSSNAQPRWTPNYTYLTGLTVDASRVLNDRGQIRFMWRLPEGSTVESRLRAKAPEIIEFEPGSDTPIVRPRTADEPPFNPYYDTKLQENYGAHKAFDQLVRTGWISEKPISGGPVGLGLRFTEPRLMKQINVRFADDNWPMPNGAYFEVFDGTAWKRPDFFINGKKPGERKDDEETHRGMGPIWTFAFPEPVPMHAFRVMVDKLADGKDRPKICEMDYVSAITSGPAVPSTEWIDTIRDKTNYVQFQMPVAAKASAFIDLYVPFLPLTESEARWLEKADFARELERTAAWWEAELARGAQLGVPEDRVNYSWNAAMQHMLTNAEYVPSRKFSILKTALGEYEAVWASLAMPEIMAMDQRGYHDDAARYLEPFFQWQGTVDPGGQFSSKEGFLTHANEYAWTRWISNHGWILWAMCDHYRLSGDRRWLDAKLPNIIAGADWILREREHTKKLDENGQRPPHWGLIPPGGTGDGAPDCYGFAGDAVTWKSLDAAASLLEEIGHPRAAELRAAVVEYKQCILRGVEYAARNTPKYKLQSTGELIPFIAMDVYNVWKLNTGIEDPNSNFHVWWLDVGPLYLIDQGVLDPNSNLAGYMMRAAEDRWMKGNVSNCEPFYMPERGCYYGRDDVDGYLEMFYTLLAEGMDRQTYVTAEGHHGVQNFCFSDGEWSRTIRMMLVEEVGKSLQLAAMTPRAWLEDGKRISIDKVRTYFGAMSMLIESNVSKGIIKAKVTPPTRTPVPMRLRLRHPQALPIKSVTVNGKAHTDFSGEWINLPAGKKPMEIVASY